MDIANNAISITLPYNLSALRGDIWLKEHFRCKDEIAHIANALAYNNEMILCAGRGGIVEFQENRGKKEGKSNKEEIEQIFEYITLKLPEWKAILDEESLDNERFCKKYIGIITPFREHSEMMGIYFKHNGRGSLEAIKIGTVHTFQGSEREIIVFSTVYGDEKGNPYNFFFNRSESDLINVAVTRAKRILVVFGRKDLLKQEDLHSSYLFKKLRT